MKPEQTFERIATSIFEKYEEATSGNMMRSPAIKWNGAVIAFFHKDSMTFKLGKEADFYMHKYVGSSYLSPFKNKPPMKSWLSVPGEFANEWKGIMEACITLNN